MKPICLASIFCKRIMYIGIRLVDNLIRGNKNNMKQKIVCKCGKKCDYIATTYERVNKLACNNSRMERLAKINN